jgi:nucleoside 2-deoxyribosyltransferase
MTDHAMRRLRSYPLVYLATPYSSWASQHEAFVAASIIGARLLAAGVKVYSPIAHTHPIALYGGLDMLDHSVWMPFDEAMMAVCECLVIARLPGFETSKGIAYEVEVFTAADKPIYELDPHTLELTARFGG